MFNRDDLAGMQMLNGALRARLMPSELDHDSLLFIKRSFYLTSCAAREIQSEKLLLSRPVACFSAARHYLPGTIGSQDSRKHASKHRRKIPPLFAI